MMEGTSSAISRRDVLRVGAVATAGSMAGCGTVLDVIQSGGADATTDLTNKSSIYGPGEDVPADVVIYWFWGDGCPHCKKQRPLMERLAQRDGVAVKAFETYNNETNAAKLKEYVEAYDLSKVGVPVTIIGGRAWLGYSDAVAEQLPKTVVHCLEQSCPHPSSEVEPTAD